MFEKRLEFDLAITQDIGVGGAPGTIFLEEISEDAVPILGGEVDRMKLYLEQLGNRGRIRQVLGGAAIGLVIVFLPVLHEQAFHLPTLFEQAQCGNRGIDATGKTDDDLALTHEQRSAMAVFAAGRGIGHICCGQLR